MRNKNNNKREDYSMDTFNEKTYRHHPKQLSDPTSDMNLLEVIKYQNRITN